MESIELQECVNSAANDLLAMMPADIKLLPDYGMKKINQNGKVINVAWWHWVIENNTHHVIFQAEKRAFIFFYKVFLCGVEVNENNNVSLLNKEQLSKYE